MSKIQAGWDGEDWEVTLGRELGKPSEEEAPSEEVSFEQRDMGTSGPGGALSRWQEQQMHRS